MSTTFNVLIRLSIIWCALHTGISQAQQTVAGSSKGTPEVQTAEQYKLEIQRSPSSRLVELKQLVPNLIYDLRYATKNNFTGTRLYPPGTRSAFLRHNAAMALRNAAKELEKLGYGIKIFDAYRPYSVTRKFWELIGDERYVANPSKGSNHNRGLAIDLTLYDLSSGKDVPMGTGFDNFTDTASHSFSLLPPDVLKNRTTLKSVMEKAGFSPYNQEWWHYNWKDNTNYSLLDLRFSEIATTMGDQEHFP